MKSILQRISLIGAAMAMQLFALAALAPQAARAETTLQGATFPHCGQQLGPITFTSKGTGQQFTGEVYATQSTGSPQHACVKDIQNALRTYVCTYQTRPAADGYFGPQTAQAIRDFQTYWRRYVTVGTTPIYVDGVVGSQTWGLLTTPSNGGVKISCA